MINADIGFYLIDSLSMKDILLSKEESGVLIFFLSGDIASKNDFISSLNATIPMDPPLLQMNNWDATSDSLGSGLDTLIDRALVIAWPNASLMKSCNGEDFQIACNILEEAASYFNSSSALRCEGGKIAVFVELNERL